MKENTKNTTKSSGYGGARAGAGRKRSQVKAAKLNIAACARKYGEGALRTLAEIAENPQEKSTARVAAANALLDRGFGRPVQQLEHTGDDGAPMYVNIVGVAPTSLLQAEEKP